VAWTPDEFARAHKGGNPIACEAASVGVPLYGALPKAAG